MGSQAIAKTPPQIYLGGVFVLFAATAGGSIICL
jgi:hypothetical protein